MIPLLAVAFVVAIASTGIFYGLFVGKLKSAPAQTVVVAAKPLRPGLVISKSDLTTMAWASPQVPKGMYDRVERVAGQTVTVGIDEGEPVLESRLGNKKGGAIGVPEGMRAVSVHISDSAGVLAMLRPGHKVDVQVFATRQSDHGPESEARTAFQNVPVLAMSSQAEPSALGNFNAPVITLLVNAREADILGVADSFGRIRIALRNPIDEEKDPKSTLPLSVIFRGAPGAPVTNAPARIEVPPSNRPPSTTRSAPSRVSLDVQLLTASPDALRELGRFGLQSREGTLDASAVSDTKGLGAALTSLRGRNDLGVLSTSHVNTGLSRTAAVELRAGGNKFAEDGEGGVRIQFVPFLANGLMHVRVEPEVTVPAGASLGTRRLETEIDISGGRGFFISGLASGSERDWLLRRWLVPGAADRNRSELLVLVTPGLL